MAFPERFLSELTEKNEITDVVSQYVKLTKRSGSNLFGLCPFHSEKTPSFSVAPDKQIFHCFGCGKGGGVISFIMEIENLSYPDAVRFLANRAGIPVPEEERDAGYGKRERMLELNKAAARFFYDCICAPGGETGRAYLEKRGISHQMAVRFGLGLAPDTWDSLTKAMRAKGYSDAELFEAGLVRRSKNGGGGVYDTFRNRLMFPVIDVRGSVIGFSGRILDDGEPKYMNSPETVVFSKSHNLFALNLAKKSKKGYIILSEGNIDVVALHQAGFDSAVASLGTSLTPEQARLISRYTDTVIIIYDGDAAGQKATQRAINILGKLNLKVKVVKLTGAKDPDEYIKKFGAAAFAKVLEGSEENKDYLLSDMAAKFDMNNDGDRISFLKEAVAYVAGFWGAVEREVYIDRLSEMTRVPRKAIADEVERACAAKQKSAKKQQQREDTQPVKKAQPAAKALRYENVKSAMAEEGVVRLLYYAPELFRDRPISSGDFSSPLLGGLFDALSEKCISGTNPNISALEQDFAPEEISLLTRIINEPVDLSNGAAALKNYIDIVEYEKIALSPEGAQEDSLLRMAEEKRRQSGTYGGKDK